LVLAISAANGLAQQQSPNWFAFGHQLALAAAAADASATQPAAQEMPRLVPWVDYGGDLANRPALTGDWGGSRQQMMDKGLRLDISLTQALQGNLSGGRTRKLRYQGGLDLVFQLDTGKAGLWPGGLLKVKAEARYGTSANADTGALMPVNADSLWPVPETDGIELSEFSYTQFLAEWIGVTLGRFSPRDTNAFASDETEQFSNGALVFNPVIGTTTPLSFLGAGIILMPTENVSLTTLVLDSEGRADAYGFATAFERGTTVFQTLELKIKPYGLPGAQRLGWTWSDKVRVQFEQNTRQLIREAILFQRGLGGPPQLAQSSDDWAIFYDFDQYIYKVDGATDRGVGLFGRFGITSGKVNVVQQFYSIGLSGKGVIPGRENDSFGVGYYYLAVSDKLGPVLSDRLEDEQGVELYYNCAVTPWLQVTPNLQIVDPVRRGVDTAVTAGLRVKIKF
jgi:porin